MDDSPVMSGRVMFEGQHFVLFLWVSPIIPVWSGLGIGGSDFFSA